MERALLIARGHTAQRGSGHPERPLCSRHNTYVNDSNACMMLLIYIRFLLTK